jgi:hypothetical protein|tara:strand:+ start:128 stop:286 length:159 start_codon:yes stop_codon:yes gene_type:complete
MKEKKYIRVDLYTYAPKEMDSVEFKEAIKGLPSVVKDGMRVWNGEEILIMEL